MATRRISAEPAYVLHRYDWSESSLILEVFTRHHGRIALVAKGVKRPTSSFRPVLLPLQPLSLDFGAEGDVRTLKSAQWVGGHVMPTGEALLAGYYLNELVMRLLARDDPHKGLFDVYAATVHWLATTDAQWLQPALRAFELLLLKDLGLLPALNEQTHTLRPLQASSGYVLGPESGLQAAGPQDKALSGQQWMDLQAVLEGPSPLVSLLRDQTASLLALQKSLRQLLNYHCGVETFRTRQMMLALQNL